MKNYTLLLDEVVSYFGNQTADNITQILIIVGIVVVIAAVVIGMTVHKNKKK